MEVCNTGSGIGHVTNSIRNVRLTLDSTAGRHTTDTIADSLSAATYL